MMLDNRLSILKLVSTIFYQNFFFHQMTAFQKLWKIFYIFSKKLFLLKTFKFLWFFPFLSTLSRFKRKNGSGIIYDVMNWFAYICRCNFLNNPKTILYNIIKLGQIKYNKGIFLDLFCNLKHNWSLVPGPFCFW